MGNNYPKVTDTFLTPKPMRGIRIIWTTIAQEVSALKIELILQEKLHDLRDEKKMTLSDLVGAADIPLSTLQRMEGKDDIRTGY